MSVNDEFAIIGFAMKDNAIHERLLSELSQEHFTDYYAKQAFHIICEMLANGQRPHYKVVAREIDHSEDFLVEAWRASGNSLDPDLNFKALHERHQKVAYSKMALMLLELTESENFTISEAENLLTNFTPFQPADDNKDYMITADKAADVAYESLIESMKNPGQIKGISMSYQATNGGKGGFKNLEECTNGLEPGTLTIFAAKSGHGKTALAMNLARIMSYHNNKRVYYLNTEMNVVQMINRWIAMATMISYEKISRGDISGSELERIQEWKNKFSTSPLIVSRIPSLSTKLVKGLVKQAMRKHGQLDCVIVDYIGRMELDSTKNMQEYQILSAIAKQLKESANELQIPFITLAQLNDEGKLEGAKKIRNECDGLFYFQPKVTEVVGDDGKKFDKPSQHEYFLVKEKVRNGGTDGVIHCEFDKPYQFIREV